MVYDILLISDSHLFGSKERRLFDVNTYRALDKVAAAIRMEGSAFDLMIASGDISEDGSRESYENFHELTKDLASYTVWMKGNHDNFSNIPDLLKLKYIHGEWHLGTWSLLFLDSTIPGKDEGFIESEEMDRLSQFLARHPDRYVVICIHHQPVDVGSEFIDKLGLQNKAAFWKTVGSKQQVKAVVFGHVHQETDRYLHNIRLISNPSTAIQFKPRSRELDFDENKYGYRALRLIDDGSVELLTYPVLPLE